MISYARIILFTVCIYTPVYCSAEDLLPDYFVASYSLHSMGNKIAIMKRSFSPLENGTFLYHSETNTTGLLSLFRNDHIVEKSTWRLDQQRFKPIFYSYKHTGRKKNRDVTIQFDWETKQITNSVNGSSWQMPIQTDTLDKLLYQLAIMRDLGTGKDPISYTVADGGKIKVYNFDMLGEELIGTPLGKFNTVKLERLRPNSKRKTTFWCAHKLNYLPIRVENIEKDGRKTTAIIEALSEITQ